MPKAEPEAVTKVTIRIFTRDYSRLQDLFPRQGAAKAIRELVRQYVQKVDRMTPAGPKLEVELDV